MLMTMDDLSKYLKVSKETIYKMAKKGTVPGSKIGTQWRFRKDQIDLWLDEQSNQQNTGNKQATSVYELTEKQ